MTYVEALEVEVNAENPVSYLDSKGVALETGDRVHVSLEQAEGSHWNATTQEQVNARPFDFGYVQALNDDGTVVVWWDLSGCHCSDPNGGPNEDPSHLTKATEETELFAGVILDNAHNVWHKLGIKG